LHVEKEEIIVIQAYPQLLVYGYLLLALIVTGVAMWVPRTWNVRVASGIVAAFVMSIPIALGLWQFLARKDVVAQEHKEVSVARQRFNELCQKAGIKIDHTVDAVDTIALLKVRPELRFEDSANPLLPGAAMAGERQGDYYISSFVGAEHKHPANPPSMRGGISLRSGKDLPGYRIVEATDPRDGKWYRYFRFEKMVGDSDQSELKREAIASPTARYAVDYEDIVDPSDRKMWIAGTVVRVVDQSTGDILATYTKYVMDGGMGTSDGTREPWVHASHRELQCPMPRDSTDTQTRYFVDQVLKPKKG
jgi:hypothetical protein